ncbi:MAG TPA: TRAP transporter large permease subunit [Anaeromyxobacter sp.]|nr:TRAP transporter large permease subunit [Anaeromyxobacter sp.]
MRIRKELLFGFSLMAIIVIATAIAMPLPWKWTPGHYGLFMLSMVVVTIMLGFPTAFTLMGMGVIFTYVAFQWSSPAPVAMKQTLDLMAIRAYGVMTNDVLISIPLFVFMGYLVERAALIEKLFKSLNLAIGRIPGSLAVATLATCALFATATGIVGAVVTLMGLLAFPAMLRSRYDIKLSAGVITAGGCLGILIPPSVLLILYGATASVSVVQLYAGAFLPGIMLAGLYMAYVVLRAVLNPSLAPKPPPEETRVELPPWAEKLSSGRRRLALPTLLGALASGNSGVPRRTAAAQLALALLPLAMVALPVVAVYGAATSPVEIVDTSGLQVAGESVREALAGGVEEPPSDGVQEPPGAGAAEPPGAGAQEPPAAAAPAATGVEEPPGAEKAAPAPAAAGGENPAAGGARLATPRWFWIVAAAAVLGLALHYSIFTLERLQIFKLLLGSFFPLSALILAVLGTIIFGWATPTEAAAMGAAGGLLLAAAYRRLTLDVVKESVFLTAKTTAMVCWLFVGSAIFSAAFALLGGQEIIERWVLSLDMTPIQFMLLAQFIIFVLGWPLEWTEIIVIFMPIFLPLLGHFDIDPLFFGLLVAMNLQTAFLSPPVAMAAFYLKGVAPRHVTLNQIFAGMMPFMAIQVIALVLLYIFPGIGLWLPQVLYR